jgi:hypothetical protein
LRWIEASYQSLGFPGLKNLYTIKFAGTCLPCLRVSKSSEPGTDILKQFKANILQWRRRCTHQRWHHQLPSLTKLILSNCSFFSPKNFAAQLPSLQVLTIKGHEELGNLLPQL